MPILFTQAAAGALTLANRIVMAPMTRSRAVEDAAPNALVEEHYAQRASAGLILTEGTASSASGLGYARTPSIHTPGQVAAWSRVTAAVHAKGGRIALQLMHVGRIAHPSNQPAGARILAPSAIAANVNMWTDAQGMQPVPPPEALTVEEIHQVVAEFAQAARNAHDAGFSLYAPHRAQRGRQSGDTHPGAFTVCRSSRGGDLEIGFGDSWFTRKRRYGTTERRCNRKRDARCSGQKMVSHSDPHSDKRTSTGASSRARCLMPRGRAIPCIWEKWRRGPST